MKLVEKQKLDIDISDQLRKCTNDIPSHFYLLFTYGTEFDSIRIIWRIEIKNCKIDGMHSYADQSPKSHSVNDTFRFMNDNEFWSVQPWLLSAEHSIIIKFTSKAKLYIKYQSKYDGLRWWITIGIFTLDGTLLIEIDQFSHENVSRFRRKPFYVYNFII